VKQNPLGPFFALLFLVSAAHAQIFTKLDFRANGATEAAGLHLMLAGPDKPANPDLWEGPLTIAHRSTPCSVDASLIQSAYLSSTGRLVVVVSVSGSNTFVHFYDTATCASRWPPIKAFTQGVNVEGTLLKLAAACACEEPGKPCTCTAGAVYRLSEIAAPIYQPFASRALTRSEVGVGFSGTRRIAHPAEGAVR
jgi:hypothetical protein